MAGNQLQVSHESFSSLNNLVSKQPVKTQMTPDFTTLPPRHNELRHQYAPITDKVRIDSAIIWHSKQRQQKRHCLTDCRTWRNG